MRGCLSFYISGSFTRFDVAFSKLSEGAAKGKYAIDWLTQGPILEGLVSRINQVNGSARLLPGRISFHCSYRNPQTNIWEKSGADVKAAFNQIVAITKSMCPRYAMTPDISIYIAPEARTQLQAGTVHIADNQVIAGGLS